MPSAEGEERTILGIRFFIGTAAEAVGRMARGGLLVVPAAPALKDLEVKASYREALLNADMAITDSAFMVMVWNWLQKDSIRRLSGLEYLRELLKQPDVRQPGNVFWIMASPVSAERNLGWLAEQGIDVPEECVYLAPMYSEQKIWDPELLERIERIRPQHIVADAGGRDTGAGGPISQAELELSAGNPLYWGGYRVSERGPGADSGVGGSKLVGLAFPVDVGASAVYAALLECAETVVFADSVQRTLASTSRLGQYSNH